MADARTRTEIHAKTLKSGEVAYYLVIRKRGKGREYVGNYRIHPGDANSERFSIYVPKKPAYAVSGIGSITAVDL